MADVRDICTAALREIGVLAAGEVAPYDDANDAMAALNRLIDQWAAERLEIFTITRTLFDLISGTGTYAFGAAAVYAPNIVDGFDSTWSTTPPDWTPFTTGSGVVSNDTSTFQSGGHSVKLDVPGLGIATIYRDFTILAGSQATITVWIKAGTPPGGVTRVQCLETSHYLTSAGAWQTASADLFTGATGAFAIHALTFNAETAPVVGADLATLRVTFYIDSFSTPGWFDTFSLANPTNLSNVARPVFIDHVHLVDTAPTPDLETPLTMLTESAWAAIAIKDLTATRPTSWYYNPTFPSGALNLWPIPTQSNLRGVIYVPTQLSTFASLSDTVSLPPGYERMFVKNLALELLPSYGRQPSPALVQQASESKATVKRANRRLADLSFPASALIGNAGPAGWDIRSGP